MAALALLGGIGCAGGVALLRRGWGAPGGGRWTAAGWALIVAGLVALGVYGGAWGVSVGAIAAMLAAHLLLTRPALAPIARRPERAPRDASVTLRPTDARDLLRRLSVFVLVVPGGMAASALAALALQGLARVGGWHEANSVTLGLLMFPVVWSILASIQMTQSGPLRMLATLAWTVLPAGAILLLVAR